ncbi:urea ABC transporter permease subunit UrtB [Methylobacterium sp. J-078]|uniref:urea ABC transporter permease subunit UrtB n=1 Tax=Methylobacterium sp. J-078 TaxID=2836657 RepID=UPI001FB8B005|nr:urea ABC transporter permease subunit UrtB [Methylobacterium sp. J-078]MCJ2044992.1 urea ABC transporter permease subunit UrtB [Methylobacterium sp. J-078]
MVEGPGRFGLAGLLVWIASLVMQPALAAAAPLDRGAFAAALCGDGAAQTRSVESFLGIASEAESSDVAWAGTALRALLDRRLACLGETALLLDRAGAAEGVDAATGAARPAAGGRSPVLGLRQRALVETASGAAVLLTAPGVEARRTGLATLERRIAAVPEALLLRAAAAETDPGLRLSLAAVAQSAALSSADPARRLAAIRAVSEAPSGAARSRLSALKADPAYGTDPAFRATLDAALARVERAVSIGDGLAVLYNGLSFASILFMAAAGLAIIFGLMGVINLAQGEFIMIGAYATYGVQEALRRLAPAWLDSYLLVAIPVAFLASAGVGIAIEALILRHLYRRPLMSLLATWAVSLFLINGVRVAVGSQNLQFTMPSYVSGGVPLYADFVVTWNRLFAIAFAAVTLVLTLVILKRTPLGLDIRAVTQNRDMAACLGIRTRRVDRLAFGFGSGLAGLAGVALCPIYSVNPGMGANFIVDSFMVVVLGGVGTVVGTLVAALGIGGANVLIEPLYGAVAAKVIVLAGIILFLQRRPEGLFAMRRRR